MSLKKAHVVISNAPVMDYRQDYVSLPDDYGKLAYYQRQDVRAICETVARNLDELNDLCGFGAVISGRKVIIKPNLVTVFHHLGTTQADFPETTDPRVLDAVILYLKQFTSQMVVAESSGRGIPTRGAFAQTGIDRIAKYHHLELVALEEQPTDRYLLPKAQVMTEAVIPRLFSEVVRGDAYYISMPKMKTNLFTGVTLGFKNAMGVLSYNLRQRNHNYALDRKLVDLLYLLSPNLTIIDGIVGGEGNCPAPVDPVDSRIIISGDHPLETDKAAARAMGFEPQEIPLIRLAEEAGFGADQTTVCGESHSVPFTPADPLLTSAQFQQRFPRVKVYFGFSSLYSPLSSEDTIGTETFQKMQLRCRGGCLAATRFGFDMLWHEGLKTDFEMHVFIGNGVQTKDGKVVYYGEDGQPIAVENISSLHNTLAVGSCSALAGKVDKFVPGCMPYPNAPHVAIHQLSRQSCRIVSTRNRYLVRLLSDTLRVCEKRKSIIRAGERIDLPQQLDDKIHALEGLTTEDAGKDWIKIEHVPLDKDEIRQLCRDENQAVLATFK